MPSEPNIEDLANAVLSVRDPHGREARYNVERLGNGTLVCSYVFRGRHLPPVDCRVGDRIELGTGGTNGWLLATGRVTDVVSSGGLTVTVDDVEVVQRRAAYREEIALPVTAVDPAEHGARRGRTHNLSVGGFAARLDGSPLVPGDEVFVRLDIPEEDQVTAVSRKVGGDIQQRFQFVNLDRRTEDRIARLVRAAELERRRGRDG